mgnify:CR=1
MGVQNLLYKHKQNELLKQQVKLQKIYHKGKECIFLKPVASFSTLE